MAAAIATVAILALAQAVTGKAVEFDMLGMSLFFGIAWFSANAVRLVILKMRGELDDDGRESTTTNNL